MTDTRAGDRSCDGRSERHSGQGGAANRRTPTLCGTGREKELPWEEAARS